MSKCLHADNLLARYLHFCANPLRDNEQIAAEYAELVSHPRVTTVAFYRPDVLMVGTDEIIINFKQRKFLIGEFIIFFIRRMVDGYWHVDFRFWNVTNTLRSVEYTGHPPIPTFIHPHILVAKDKLLECPNGSLCISKGQFSVYQHIRKGEIHRAVPRLIDILEIYPTGQEHHSADNWPLYTE
jgi:hypothetical protein